MLHAYTLSTIHFICTDLRHILHIKQSTSKEALSAWTYCVSSHLDKLLATLQSKFDFCPQADSTSSGYGYGHSNGGGSYKYTPEIVDGRVKKHIDCTDACNHVVKALLMIASSIRHYKQDFSKLDLTNNFWLPLGQQLIGIYICHLRRLKVSPQGCKRLLQDLDEYFQVSNLLALYMPMVYVCMCMI